MKIEEKKQPLLTITYEDGKSRRDVWSEDLNEQSRPIANELSSAIAVSQARKTKYEDALAEIRTNEIVNAHISFLAEKLEKVLPPLKKQNSKEQK